MTDREIHHFTYPVPKGRVGQSNTILQVEPNTINVKDEDIYTGEFVIDYPYEYRKTQTTIFYLKRKAKDHYVFLKDYKPKIAEIITKLGRLEFHFGYFRKNKRKEDKEWRRRIGEREKLLSERIEKLEKEVLNLKNPPLKPILKNPFD